MTIYDVTITFAVNGEERHAEKTASKAEAAIAKTKRLIMEPDGSTTHTTIKARP